MPKKLMLAPAVANWLGVSVQRIYELCRNPDLRFPVVRIGERQYRFDAEAIEQWIENGGTAKIAPKSGREKVRNEEPSTKSNRERLG